jgi:hypothetical protein
MILILLGILVIFVNIVYTDQELLQDTSIMSSPAGLPGMRGIPSNIPDISIIGDFYGKLSNNKTDDERNRLTVREIELAFQGYIYPEMRADIFLAMHKHGDHIEPEICESKVSFLKLFNNFSAEVGKIHINFGKINKVHQHHRPYVDQPQVITNFLGDHGLVGEGAVLSYLFSLPFFAQIDVGAYRIPLHEHEAEEVEVTGLTDTNGNPVTKILVPGECGNEFGLADEVYTSRVWLSFSLNEKSELEFGASGATGKGSHYTHHKDEAKVTGLDLTYKLWPSAHTRLILQNEILYLVRDIPVGEIKRIGFYSYLGYKFNKYWSAGIRYDDAEDAFPHPDSSGTLSVNISERTRTVSVIVTRDLTETTLLRGQYKYYFEGLKDIYESYLQITFGMGPHSHLLE